MQRRMTVRWAVVLMTLAAAPAAQGADPVQNYPVRPVRIITGSPGSTADFAARFVGHKLSERWGQQVVVDNRAGAGGIIGAEIAAKSAPDGYTLLIGHIGTHASPQFLFSKLPYDPVRDFEPISLLTDSGIALVVNAALPTANLKEFVAYAKSKPGTINYASAGGGTSSQLSGELFNQMTGARLVHVPYKGAGFALNAVVANETQSAFLSTTTANAQVKAGRLRALAVLSEKRFPSAPEIPSAPESGFPGLNSSVWMGLYAPAKTPKAIIARVNREVVQSLNLPDTRSVMAAQGAVAMPTTPEEFGAFLNREIAKWGSVIKAAGIKAQ